MRSLLVAAIAAAVVSQPVSAQATGASIEGRVVAPQNGSAADVQITVKNASTGFTASSRTRADGRFVFLNLPLGGPYTVTASRIGFSPTSKSGYQLALGARAEVALELD